MSKAFEANVFYIHSTVKMSERPQLQELIKANGGKIINMLTNGVTHIIVANVLKDSNEFQIAKAKQMGKKVISVSWVAKNATAVPEGSGSSGGNSGGTPQGSSGSFSGGFASPVVVDFQPEISSFGESTTAELGITTSDGITPTISKVVPNTGPVTGDLDVAIYGLNFIPGPKFRIKFGNVLSGSYQFHSHTSVLVHVPPATIESGEVAVSASNDGVNFGFPWFLDSMM